MSVPTPNWCHTADVLRVIDGDTFVARIDLGRYPMKVEVTATIRVAGLFCPELKEAGGPEAKGHALELLMSPAFDVHGVTLTTRKPDPRDPYGRVVADVALSDGRSFSQAMIDAGHGTSA